MTQRIDVHQHVLPPAYRAALTDAGIGGAGGRPLPEWSLESALETMDLLQLSSAILSVSTPGTTFLDDPSEAAALAAQVNDFSAGLTTDHPGRFGFFATLPTPHPKHSTTEGERALDELQADGVTLLANSAGTYLGQSGLEPLFEFLDDRAAVVFVHPAQLPGPSVEDIPPFAADFLLDTTRAAFLLVRNGYIRRYPRIRFILSHAGGFVPYTSHRMALSIARDTGRSPLDVLEDFRSFYFDTALSSSPAALPTLLAFAQPGHVLYGSDWPFAPTVAAEYFKNGLETYSGMAAVARYAIGYSNAAALFPRLATTPVLPSRTPLAKAVRRSVQRSAARSFFRLVQPR